MERWATPMLPKAGGRSSCRPCRPAPPSSPSSEATAAPTSPVWVDLDGDDIVFLTSADTIKGKAILRDPRVSLCLDDERPPFSFVTITGTATTSADPDELLRWATTIGGRYMGEERAEAVGRRNAVPPEMVVRVRPTKVVAKLDVAD